MQDKLLKPADSTMWEWGSGLSKHGRVGISVKDLAYVWGPGRFSAEENSEGYILKIHERKNSLVPYLLLILTSCGNHVCQGTWF